MSQLIVGGVTIPVSPTSINRDRLDAVDRARAFDLTYRASVTGNPKRDFHFSTPPISRQKLDFYEGILANPVPQTCSGDILGGSRNGFTKSEQFDDAAWTKTNVTVSANIVPGLDGTISADRIVETAVNASHGVSRTTPALTANTAQASSVFASPGERTWMYVQTFDKAGVTKRTWFNLATGVAGTTAAGHTPLVEIWPLGWYRILLLWNSATGATPPEVLFGLATADNTSVYLGDITKGLYLWGAQHDTDLAAATSYAKTTTAAIDTTSANCCAEIVGWHPVRLATGHAVVLDFILHEV